jgi:hypothetical protein
MNLKIGEVETLQTFNVFRQFPELRRSMNEIETSNIKIYRKLSPLKRDVQLKSTHVLEILRKSSIDEINVMHNFRKTLIESRLKNNQASLKSISNISQSQSNDSYYNDLDPLEIADRKLTKISLSFDYGSVNSHLEGFQGPRLTKTEFNILLKRCLNINLRKQELDALFLKMDKKKDNLIDGVEFVRYFFILGNKARRDFNMEIVNRIAKNYEEKKKKTIEEEEK